ncbi:MAG: hypothetical protein AAB290_04370 [Candidatus Eisenbacteria bacterium]
MSARIALPTLVLAALAALSLPCPAAAGPWGLAPGESYVNLEGSTFTASSFHFASGFRADTGLVVEQRALGFSNEIGWKKRITIVFALPAVSVTRRDARVQGTATGFQDARLGMRYNLMNGPTAVAVEAGWSAPAGYNRHLDSLGFQLGDGLQELSAGVALGTGIFGRGFIQGSLGYGYRYLAIGKRDKGPVVPGDLHPAKYLWAGHLLASADLGLWVRPSLLVGGRYRGRLSLSSGPLVQETDAHLAGPVLLYRVDDRLDVFAGSWSTASGRNTLHFNQVYVGMAFHKTKLNRLQGFLGGKQAP